MIFSECPVCGDCETVINEIDRSTCCGNCGIVLRESDLLQYHEQRHKESIDTTEINERVRRPTGRGTEIKIWWDHLASFYGMGEDLIAEGIRLIDKHFNSLPYQNMYAKETAVALASSIGKAVKPTWTCQDFIEAFPMSLRTSVVFRNFKVFEGEKVEPYRWADYSEVIVHSTMEKVYDLIVKQLFKKEKVPEIFNKQELILLTRKLLKLGTYQGINAGKKSRPLVTATACICALQLRLTANRRDDAPKKKKIKRTKQASLRYVTQEEILNHRWNFEELSKSVNHTPKTLRRNYREYTAMLMACVKKIPWTNQDLINDKNVYTYLDDIFTLFTQEKDQAPFLSLTLLEFAPFSFKRHRENELKLQDVIELVKTYIKDNAHLEVEDEYEEEEEEDEEKLEEKKRSLIYDVYLCLKAGCTEKEIASWTIHEVHNRGELIRFKEQFISGDEAEQKSINLDELNGSTRDE